jgi:hypothetical protein
MMEQARQDERISASRGVVTDSDLVIKRHVEFINAARRVVTAFGCAARIRMIPS